MMSLLAWLQTGAQWAGIGLLCMGGLFLSLLSLSGAWLAVAAFALAAWWSGPAFPGWPAVLIAAGLAGAVEVFEYYASFHGVAKRGGARSTGWMAFLGGIAGLFVGGWLPVPLLGPMIGMTAGGFAAAYLWERHKLRQKERAAHVAFGVVMARLAVMLVKTAVTAGLAGWLLGGLLLNGALSPKDPAPVPGEASDRQPPGNDRP